MKKIFIVLVLLLSTIAYAESEDCGNKNAEINDQQNESELVRKSRDISSIRDFFPDGTSR